MTSNWLDGKQKHWSDVENAQKSRFGRTNIFPWSCISRMYSKTMWNEQRYGWQLQNHVWMQNLRRSNCKLPCSENLRISSWSYDMESHAKKCVERYCELANKTTQQLYKVSTPCIDDHHLFQRSRIEVLGRIVNSMHPNCSKMLILGTNWTTRYSMVSEQTCTVDQKMDQSVWQTMISFDFLHSSYMWIQTVLLCG